MSVNEVTRLQVVEREGARDAAGKALYDAVRATFTPPPECDVPRSALPWEMLTDAEAEMWRVRAWSAVTAYYEAMQAEHDGPAAA